MPQDTGYRQREVSVKIVFLQSFENQNERIHQSSNPPKSGYKLLNKVICLIVRIHFRGAILLYQKNKILSLILAMRSGC